LGGDISSERAARNQSLYRSINEKFKELNQNFSEAGIADSEWICECADTHCTLRIPASLHEYDAVRSNPRTFIVSPSHVHPEVERVLNQNDRYMIVEKIDRAGQIAETLNPRPSPDEPSGDTRSPRPVFRNDA
jgi:hypothetical protein